VNNREIVVDQRPALGGGAFAERGGRRRIFPRDKQFAQGVKIAAEYRQGHVSLEADFRFVATTHQAVARLHAANRRLHSRMSPPRLMKRFRRFGSLLCRLLDARFRQANMIDKAGQLPLILR